MRRGTDVGNDGDERVWVVIQAADNDSRPVAAVESPAEPDVPPQYRSIADGSGSLLDQTLQRAAALAPRERICAVVPAEHREWWRRPLWLLPASNVVAMPRGRAASHGVSVSLMRIHERDPAARVVLLHATSHGRDEEVLSDTVDDAAAATVHGAARAQLRGVWVSC
jgi:mannose-1-phosphate guanylyltransferase